MTDKTVIIEIPAPPPGYGQPVLGVPSGPHAWLYEGSWDTAAHGCGLHCIYALPETPWYPQDWIDDPKLGVHEVPPGEWPPCKPGDVIQVLTKSGRDDRLRPINQSMPASDWSWLPGHEKVAIRIIRRAGDA